ncbi:ATP-binding protein [Peribacillus sp. NPDC096447]|uniref:ATP-binding protein n=1 Tax=Peribacillus sp. NPDC096447 TaxID=3364394 RepID=UPI0037FFAAA2
MVRLSFTVKDTGIGIPTDKIDRLFHSFNHPKGLAICKRLTELMGPVKKVLPLPSKLICRL